MDRFPVGVDLFGFRIVIATVEQNDLIGESVVGQQLNQIVLGLSGFGEDDGFLWPAQIRCHLESDFQTGQQCKPFGVFGDVDGLLVEVTQFANLMIDCSTLFCGQRRILRPRRLP